MVKEGNSDLEHKNCYKNYEGTSTGMESELAVRGVREISEEYDADCDEIL